MKISLSIILLVIGMYIHAFGQKKIKDKNITYQQERMVFKQWDKSKFTPTSGFLGLNPEYWLTWALHPDYPKKDLRPLGPYGPQTQRLAFVAAMQNTENSYKLNSDTLRNTALTETLNYSGQISSVDPLWLLYYQHKFSELINYQDATVLNAVGVKESEYLIRVGAVNWYLDETHILQERLNIARTTTVDRGSRILVYHRLLEDYKKVKSLWDTKKSNAKLFIKLSESNLNIKTLNGDPIIRSSSKLSDEQIADEILRKAQF